MTWTDSQKDAIKAKGNVIVTAAAGSGKTAVLVERVIKKLCDEKHPISADRLLIVTFTNAAAAEMRQRIEKALADRLAADPGNTHLLKQRLLIPSADICTIDSFCIRLVRNNFSVLGISPDFKIAEDIAANKIKDKAIKKVFGEFFKNNDADFLMLLNALDSEYGTENAEFNIKEIVDFSHKLPQSKRWLVQAAEAYNPQNINSSVWTKAFLDMFVLKLNSHLLQLSNCRKMLFSHNETELKFGTYFDDAIDFVKNLLSAIDSGDWNLLYKALSAPPEIIKQFSLSKKYDPILFEKAKASYTPFKDTLKKMSSIFNKPVESLKDDFEFCQKIVAKLTEIAIKYDETYIDELIKKSLLTFNVIEKMALELLTQEDENGDLIPSEISKSIVNSYDEILVDEYQDINDLQGKIFEILSDNCKHLFTVGDVKQSIYGFRGSNPKIFLKRSDNADFYSEDLPSDKLKRVVLSKNFRSRSGVCDFINAFFSVTMSKDNGDIDYDENEKLYPEAEYLQNNLPAAEMHFIKGKDGISSTVAEAEYLAEYIEKTVNSAPFLMDKDKKSLRGATYGDFAVLYRSGSNIANYIKALKKRGIPVSLGSGDYFKTTEVMTAISLIKAVENPMSDIPMLSILLSPIFGFTENDIAELKVKKRYAKIYSLVLLEAENGNEKCRFVRDKFSFWRSQAACLSTADFVGFVLADSGYANMVLSLPDAQRRLANLNMLENIADTYFSEAAGDLSGFVSHLNYMEANANTTSALVAENNAVHFTTMHKSKGLQFPITVIIGAANNFSNIESKQTLYFNEKLGISFKYIDDEQNKKLPCFTMPITENILAKKRADEEMRLLYVAMTRAEERLVIMAGVGANFDAKVGSAVKYIAENLQDDGSMAPLAAQEVSGIFGWLLPVVLQTPAGRKLALDLCGEMPKISKYLQDVDLLVNYTEIGVYEPKADNEKALQQTDKVLTQKIKDIFDFKYPYAELNSIETKTSVSELTKQTASREFCATRRPAFMSSKGLTPTERGTALHKFMQYADFSKVALDPVAEVERLYEYEYISRAEADAIDPKSIIAFTKNSIFNRILNCDRLMREQRFLLDVKAGDIYDNLSDVVKDQTVIVQGAVDCMFIEGDHIVLLDFKTDKTDDESFLIKHYSDQLKTYCIAAEKMFSLPVTECYIYSLNMNKTIKII